MQLFFRGAFFMPTWRLSVDYIKQRLIAVLRESQEVGFRESNYPDDELISLLVDIAEEFGINPNEYEDNNDCWRAGLPDEQQAGYIA